MPRHAVPTIMMMRAALMALLALGASCTPLQVITHTVSANEARVPVGRYAMDAQHWSITFDVDHLQYSRFTMRFDRATAQLDWRDGGLDSSPVVVAIDAASVNTNVAALDKLVSGPGMLDAARYPEIRFVSTGLQRSGAAQGKLSGDLTIHGVTRAVTLDIVFNGYAFDPLSKKDTLGFSAQGRFNRSLFGLNSWYPAVGNEVRVRIEAEFGRPPADLAAGGI